MADDRIDIKIGAQIDGLVAGVQATQDQIEGLLAPINDITAAFSGMFEAGVAAFGIERLLRFGDAMDEIGARTEHMSQMLGLSSQELGAFTFAAGAMGLSSDAAGTALERFERNMAQAAGGASGPASAAFKALGLSVTDAAGHIRTLDDILPEIADQFAATADGPEKTAIAIALFGRAGAEMIPFLDQGREGLERFRQAAIETGTVLSDAMTRGMEESAIKSYTLGKAFEGLGLALYQSVEKPLDAAAESMTRFIEKLTAAFSTSGQLKQIEAIRTEIEHTKQAIADAQAEIASGISPEEIERQQQAHLATLTPLGAAGHGGGLLQMPGMDAIKEAAPAAQIASSRVQELTQKLADLEKQLAEAEKIPPPATGSKPPMAQMDLGSGGTSETSLADSETQGRELAYHNLMDVISQERAEEAQEAAQAQKNAGEITRSLDEEYRAQMRLAEEGKRAADEAVRDAQRVAQQQHEQAERGFQQMMQPFDQMLHGVLSGTQTISQAFERMAENLATSFAEAVAKMIAQWLAFEALTAAGSLGIPGASGLAGSLGAGPLGALFSGGGLSSLFSGGAGGGFAAATPEIMGVGAAFAEGSWSVPSTGAALVHQGEMILPAGFADAVRGGSVAIGGGAGANFNINLSSIDSRSAAAFFNNPTVARALQAVITRNTPVS